MKLIGNIDGVEVMFDFHPPNQFKAEIPKKLNGIYIVELKLIDDAGNETTSSGIFVGINFSEMSFEILEGFDDKEATENYDFEEIQNEFNSKEINEIISFEELMPKYSHRELVI